MTDLWCVHIIGPDDVIAAPSKEAAEAKAHEMNAWLARFNRPEWEVLVQAEVAPWPHTAEAHALDLPKWAAPKEN